MKRLLFTYLFVMVFAFGLPPALTSLSDVRKPEGQASPEARTATPGAAHPLALPKEIPVHFHKEGQTRMMDFEEYIKGVLPAEMPAAFEPEAQKAQAVAARTYAYHKYRQFLENPEKASPNHPDAVVCTNFAHCSAYYTPEELLALHGQAWIDKYLKNIHRYVDETKGEIITYDNEPILAVFHASSAGGATEASGDVWETDLPYLSSVESIDESRREGYYSTVTLTHEQFKEKILEKYPEAVFDANPNKWVGKTTRTRGNHINTIAIGNVTLKGTEARGIFGLKSTHFDLEITAAEAVFTVSGSGHGVGMSQHGANEMAKNGSTYIEILETYYQGASVARHQQDGQ